MSERQEGWYWVKPDADQWEAAFWDGGAWLIVDAEGSWPESEVEIVGQRIPSPDEPWVTVPVEATPEMLHSAGNSAEAYHGMLGAWTLMLRNAPKP